MEWLYDNMHIYIFGDELTLDGLLDMAFRLQVVRKSDNKVYALKRIKINKMSKREISDALNEIRFLASIRQKNIVGFYEAFLENKETELCIIMEYCGCGDLAQKVERYKRRKQYIDEDVIWRYLIQSLKALVHLHEKGICHRDLKTANSFLAEDGSIKIGDMNVSKRLKKGHLQTQIGTPYYMSPEIWNNRPYDASSDLWSLGCMMYELCALKPPFVADSFPALKRAVTAGRYSPIPRKFSDSLAKVIGSMLKLNPNQRPTANALLNHPDVVKKHHLDGEVVPREPLHAFPGMMATIKVPQNLRKLNQALPKPCYADARPNSPTAWVVTEQAALAKKEEKAAKAAVQAAIAADNAAALAAEVAADNGAAAAALPEAPVMAAIKKKAAAVKLDKITGEKEAAAAAAADIENKMNPIPAPPQTKPALDGAPRRQRPQYDNNGRRVLNQASEGGFRYGGVGNNNDANRRQQQQRNPYYNKYANAQQSNANNAYGRHNYEPAGAGGPGAPSGYAYNRYGHGYGGPRAAGQPSKAYHQRMW